MLTGLTLGLYNGYDPKTWHDIMRITLGRAAPLAVGFGFDLATIGFPYAQARERGAKRSVPLATPEEVAQFVAAGQGLGEAGRRLAELAAAGRFTLLPYPDASAFPRRLGRVVATTPQPDPGRRIGPADVARELSQGRPQILLVGLGPRGLPGALLDAAEAHFEVTGRGVSLETATAMGAIPAAIAGHLEHLQAGLGGRKASPAAEARL